MNRSLSELCRTFTQEELFSLPGDRARRYEALRLIFEDLREGKLIYQERFTALVEVVDLKLTAQGFAMEVRSLAVIKRPDRGVISRLPGRWRFGNTWEYCTLGRDRHSLENHPDGFRLWPEVDLVRRIEALVATGGVRAAEDLLWGRSNLKQRRPQVA